MAEVLGNLELEEKVAESPEAGAEEEEGSRTLLVEDISEKKTKTNLKNKPRRTNMKITSRKITKRKRQLM